MLSALGEFVVPVPCVPDDIGDNWELSPVQLQDAEAASATLASGDAPEERVIEAIRALGQMQRGAGRYAGLLVPWLKHTQPEVRRVVIWAMGQMGEAACRPHVETLVSFLGDSDGDLLFFLQFLLCNMGKIGADALAEKVASEKAEDLLAGQQAVTVLAQIGSDGAAALAFQLQQPLDCQARHRVAMALSQLPEALQPQQLELVAGLLLDADASIRATAARILGLSGAASAVQSRALARAVGDESEQVRARAVEALGSMGAAGLAHTACVVSLLWDPETSVRLEAVKALGNFGKVAFSKSKNPLHHFDCDSWTLPAEAAAGIALQLRDSDRQQAFVALEALQNLGAPGSAVISHQLFFTTGELHELCLKFLVKASEEQCHVHTGCAALRLHLNSTDTEIRMETIRAVRQCGKAARGLTDVLYELSLRDPSTRVRRAAASAVPVVAPAKFRASDSKLLTVDFDAEMAIASVPVRELEEMSQLVKTMEAFLQSIEQVVQEKGSQFPPPPSRTARWIRGCGQTVLALSLSWTTGLSWRRLALRTAITLCIVVLSLILMFCFKR